MGGFPVIPCPKFLKQEFSTDEVPAYFRPAMEQVVVWRWLAPQALTFEAWWRYLGFLRNAHAHLASMKRFHERMMTMWVNAERAVAHQREVQR